MNTSAADSGEGGRDFTRVWGVLAQIITPATFVAAIMMYFGAVRTKELFEALGVDQSVLGLSVQDYALRGAPLIIEPLVMLLLVALFAIPVHVWLTRSAVGRRITMWTLVPLAALGVAGIVAGIVGMAGWEVGGLYTPIYLGAGVLALVYAATLWLRAKPRRAISTTDQIVWRMISVALLLVLLLWTLAEFAENRGEATVDEFRRFPGILQGAMVYAPRRLHLEGPGITETALPDANAMYRYRYTGLRLLIHANQRYVLLPACWATARQARAIALPADGSLRLEFFSITGPPACP